MQSTDLKSPTDVSIFVNKSLYSCMHATSWDFFEFYQATKRNWERWKDMPCHETSKTLWNFIHHDPILFIFSLFLVPILAHLKYNKFQFELEMPLCVSENTLAMADEHSHKYGNILQNKFMDTFSLTHKHTHTYKIS